MRTLGRRFGKNLPKVNETLAHVNGRERYAELKEKGYIEIEIAGQLEELKEEDLLISAIQAEGLATASDHGITIALDTKLNDTLIAEGNVREIISKVQNMRKESGFEVANRIHLYYADNDELGKLIEMNKETIQSEVLALEISPLKADVPFVQTWNINGQDLTIGMEVIQ